MNLCVCVCVWVFVQSGCVCVRNVAHQCDLPRMLCAVNTSVSETSRAACGCNLGCLHFVHGSACTYNCVLDFA